MRKLAVRLVMDNPAHFFGHEVGVENWASLANLIANNKMGDFDPVSYISQTMHALLDGHSKNRID